MARKDMQREMISSASQRVSDSLIKALADKAAPKPLTGIVGQITKNGDLVLWKPGETPSDGYSCRDWSEVMTAIQELTGWHAKDEPQEQVTKLH